VKAGGRAGGTPVRRVPGAPHAWLGQRWGRRGAPLSAKGSRPEAVGALHVAVFGWGGDRVPPAAGPPAARTRSLRAWCAVRGGLLEPTSEEPRSEALARDAMCVRERRG